jgi:hypothetical protein
MLGDQFGVTKAGDLYAQNAHLMGGYIGANKDLQLTANGITGGSSEGWSLTKAGFYLNTNAKIRVGSSFNLYNSGTTGKIEVEGPLQI